MTIDERFERLMTMLPLLSNADGDVNGHRNVIRNALLDVARDQRHTCAEAVAAMDGDYLIGKAEAIQATMNANIQ